MGIKDNKFSSSPIHLVNQELEEMAIIRPITSEIENIIRAGCEFGIKKRILNTSWTGYEPVSLNLAYLFTI